MRSFGAILVITIAMPWTASVVRAQTTFQNEAIARGVAYVPSQGGFGGTGQFGCGVVLADLDNDGDPDIVACGNAADTIGVFANDGQGHFTDVSAASGIGVYAKPSGLVAGDYDGDGDLDLFLSRWIEAHVLLRNDGNLHFTDVTASSGIAGATGAGGGSAFGDFDGDGWIDLAVANRTAGAAPAPNALYRNQGDGTFVDVAAALGVTNGFPAFQCSWFDIDRDDDLDLYVGNDKGAFNPRWNRLYRNLGDGTFVDDVGCGADVHADAMGNAVGDLDLDGWPEIYVPNIPAGNILLRSPDGGATFVDVAADAGVAGYGLCWGSAFLDGDNDGDLDLVSVGLKPFPNFYFENVGPWPLADHTLGAGLAAPADSYCLAIGDVDGDGDEDLLVQSRLENLKLFVNKATASPMRRWIQLEAKGRGANTFGIGTTVDVAFAGLSHWRQVAAGTAYKSQSSYVMHVGLGAAEAATVTVRFPRAGDRPAETRVLANLAANRRWPLWPTERLGDADGDGAWTAAERSALQALIGQPFEPPCAIYDFDGDGDVDRVDDDAFVRRLSDLDRDGIVGPRDLAILLGAWGDRAPDLDGDRAVGESDLAILLGAWTH
jgi:hypothetical protein